MKSITLQKLTFVNFKGIRNLTIDFASNVVEIKGSNGSGKTTVADGFFWNLFGKNSEDVKDFNVKTLDANNKVIEKLEHTVTAILNIDGVNKVLSRTLREKWQKKRGSEESEFTGNETIFAVDDVPYQAGEYQAFISSIIDESVFKMITNPLAFNALKWVDRRTILTSIVGEVSDAEIAKTKPEFEALLKDLAGKSFDDYKKQIAVKKKLLRDELALFPARIDEVRRSIPTEIPDYKKIQMDIVQANNELSKVDEQINNSLKLSESVLENEKNRQSQVYNLYEQLAKVEHGLTETANKEYRTVQSEIKELSDNQVMSEQQLTRVSADLNSTDLKIEYQVKRIADLRTKWNEENAKAFHMNPNEIYCPTCKRDFDPSMVAEKRIEMESNFNKNKVETLRRISADGKTETDTLKSLKDENAARIDKITALKDQIAGYKAEIEKLNVSAPEKVNVESDPEYIKIKDQITAAEKETFEKPNLDEVKLRKHEIQCSIDALKTELQAKENIDKAKARISELEQETRNKSQELANLEKQEYTMLNFEMIKNSQIEAKVNQLFTEVKFKLFNQLINGSIEPCCDCLIGGVPFQDVNSAGQKNAGIAIINVLCEHYQVRAPIMADQAESTSHFIHTDSQLIKLTVSEKDKVLRVE